MKNRIMLKKLSAVLLSVSTLLSFSCCTPNEDITDNEVNSIMEFYVSPSGSDENDGLTVESAFATLERAKNAVQNYNSDMKGDVTVFLCDGVWELTETLSFGTIDSGTNGYNIVYKALDGTSPVISGGTRINTNWEIDTTLKNGNVIYKTPLKRDVKLRALYVNGERRYMASTDDAIEAKGSWGTYTIGNAPTAEDYEWNTIYTEDFEDYSEVSQIEEISSFSKSGSVKKGILDIKKDGENSALSINHTANEDCGFDIPDVTYENGMITFRIMLSSDHVFSHGWEALHINGANNIVDKNGRSAWAGLCLAPHLDQLYFQHGTSGGKGSDEVSGQLNTASLSIKNGVWYYVKMMVTDNGYYYSKMWREKDKEPEDFTRLESFDPMTEESFLRIYAYKNNNGSKMDIRVDDIKIESGTLKTSAEGSSLPEWAWSTGSKFDGIKYSKADLPKITRNIEDVEIENQQTWNKNTVCVREIESDRDGTWILKLQQPYGAIAQTPGWGVGLQGSGKHIIYNAYELLDEKGEFYFDKTEQMLYYIPLDGEDINTAEFVVPRLQTVIEFKGTPEVSGDLTTAGEKTITGQVQNIVFDGITVAYSDWNLQKVGDSYGKSTVQAGTVYTAFASDHWHGDMYRNIDTLPGAVEMEFAHNIKFLNGAVILTGAEGILLSNDVDNCEVTGNYIYNTGGGGVVIGNPQHIYENDSLEPDIYAYRVGNGNTYIRSDGASADREKYQNGTERVPRNVTVSNNILYENCRLFPSHCPVTLFFTQNVKVTHNFIKNAAYSGISAGWGWCNFDGKTADFLDWGTDNNQGGSVLPGYPTTTSFGNEISYNRIEDTMTILWDGGLIYTLGEQRDTLIYGNSGKGSQHGLYQDEGSAYFATIENNVVSELHGDAIFAVSYGRKHDLKYNNNYADRDNISIAPKYGITNRNFHYIRDGMWPKAASDIVQNSGLTAEYKALHAEVLNIIYQNSASALLPESASFEKGEKLTLNSWLDGSYEIWIAPVGTKEFSESEKMTLAKGNAAEMDVPTVTGIYKLYVKASNGEIFTSKESVRVK